MDIYRRLAETRPDAFLPDLAMSLGALGQTHLGAGRNEAAATAFEEGLTAIAPFAEQHPQAFGDLARGLGGDYIEACEKAGTEPNGALLQRVARALGAGGEGAADTRPEIPDEAVRQLMAHPDLQEGLTAFMRENNIEGTPADLPIEMQRPLAAAILQAMAKAKSS